MKQDDEPLRLERLSAAEAPELFRAISVAKRQLPSAPELAALAASLSIQGAGASDARLAQTARMPARLR